MATPQGPVRARVRTASRAITDLPRDLGPTLPTAMDIALPDAMVSQYPDSAATEADRRRRRKPWDMNPVIASPAISPIARAVPDIPSPETDRVTSDSTEVTVPTEATVDMNLSGRSSGNTMADMDAPTVAVIPGNHPATVPMRTPLRPGSGPTGSSLSSRCGGILPPSADSSRTGMPKRPVRRGSMMLPSPRAPSTGMGRVMQARPRKPEIVNAAIPQAPVPRRHSP